MEMPTKEDLQEISGEAVEEECRIFGLHWMVLISPIIFCVATFFGLLIAISFIFAIDPEASEELRYGVNVVGVLAFLASAGGVMQAMTAMATTRLTIYADRVEWTTGCFARIKLTSLVRQVVGCDFGQTWFERLLDCGTLSIETKGVDRLLVRKIDRAPEAARTILYLQRKGGSTFDG